MPLFLSRACLLATLAIASFPSATHASLTPSSLPSSYVYFTASALTPEDDIVVAGALFDPQELRQIVARYTAHGQLDPTFGERGYVVLDRTESPNPPDAVAVGPGGSITISGPGHRLTRLTSRGEPDRSFGVAGSVDSEVASAFLADNLAVDSAGRPLVAGSIDDTLAVERFTVHGQPDPSFDGDGIAIASPVPASSLQGLKSFQRGKVVAVRPDGRIMVLGEALLDTGEAEVIAAQFNADGSPDPTFDADGISRIPVTPPVGVPQNPGYYAVQAIDLDQAGTAAVRLAPETSFPSAPSFCSGGSALRIRVDGALDPVFGIGSAETGGVCPADVVALDGGGTFVVGHEYVKEGPNSVIQDLYTADGRFDPAFGYPSRPSMVAGLPSQATSVEQMANGTVIAVGSAESDTCLSPVAMPCRMGFLLAQRPNGEVVGGFGRHGLSTLPETRVCGDPFERCPYPDRDEFARYARRSLAGTFQLSSTALRATVDCPLEVRERCRVRAWFTAVRSHRVLARIQRTSIRSGSSVSLRSRPLTDQQIDTASRLARMKMHVVYSAAHQRPVRFAHAVVIDRG